MRPIFLSGVVGMTLALGASEPLCAEISPSVSEADYLNDLPVVLSASRLSQPQQEAPAAVTVIDQEMIRASGFREIPDLFRLVPGFSVSNYTGSIPVVTYHGMSDAYSRRMQVLVDGRSIYNVGFGQVNWRDLPLAIEDIDHIEIVRGPNAATYGPNAFLAVINIVSRHAAETHGNTASISTGQDSIRDGMLRHGGQIGALDYRVTVAQKQDERYKDFPSLARDRLVNLRGDYQLNDTDALSAQLGYSEGKWRKGDPGDFTYPTHDQTSTSDFVQLHFRRAQGAQREWSLQFNHSHNKLREEWIVPLGVSGTPVPPPLPAPLPATLIYPVNLNYEAWRDSLEYQMIANPRDDLRLVWGAEIRRDQIKSDSYLGTGKTLGGNLYRLFANGEWRVTPRWIVQSGAMLEKQYYSGTTLSPRLAVNYLMTPGHALRASISRGYRSPTPVEQGGDFKFAYSGLLLNQVNQNHGGLQPERVLSREIGYVGDFRKQRLTLDARLFYDQYSNLIGQITQFFPPGTELLDPVNGYTTTRNLRSATLRGAEFQLRWRPIEGALIIVNQAWTTVHSDDAETRHSVPHRQTSVLISQAFKGGYQASAGYYQEAAMTWLGEGDPVKRYERIDARLARRWRAGVRAAEIALVGQALNGAYSEFRPEYRYDRRAFVTLTLEF
jgi:iron complex outermembrane receptor protein